MEHLPLENWFWRFGIAGSSPDGWGPADPEPVVPLAREAWFRKAAAAGVSTRDVKDLAPPGLTGTSRSRYSDWFVKDSSERQARMKSRRFDLPGEPPVVAVLLDATHFKKRGKQKEAAEERAGVVENEKDEKTWTVTIVIGVRADGSRISLASGVTPGEHSEPIHELLDDVVERGVSRRALFVADQGPGIRAAIKRLTRSENPCQQICTTHAAGIVKGKVPEAMRDGVAKELYGAWKEDDPDAALEQLESQAAELEEEGLLLEEEGLVLAAKSVRRFAPGSVTVQRLGLTGAARVFLRSTNSQEGSNALVKLSGSLPNVSWWKDQEMLERWVAWQLIELEETRWNRVPEPEQLIALAERILDFDGAEELRAQVPPAMSIAPLPVSFEHDEQMLDTATRWWTDHHREADWLGSPSTLEVLGLDFDKEVTPEVLLDAMRCHDPTRAAGDPERRLRHGTKISFPTRDADGKPVEVHVDGILGSRWTLKAPPALMDQWRQGGDAAATAEQWLLIAAPAAVERATLTTSPHHEFAGILALRRPSQADPHQPLAVEGITFAVQRGRSAKLGSPASKEMLRSRTARAAEDAAQEVLGELLRGAPAPSERERTDSEPSPALLAGIEAAALERAPDLVGVGDGELGALIDGAAAAREGLRSIAPEVADWWEANWQPAAQQIAAERLRSHPSSRPPNDPWWPLDARQRLVLSEARAQRLLGAAAMLEGLAAANPDAARDLIETTADPLAELGGPAERAQSAAAALAAERELERRRLFAAAREETERARAQQLLDAAAMLEGLAAADPAAARDLIETTADPLAELRGPAERAQSAAAALAAERELERGQLFAAAREETERAPPPQLRYGGEDFVVSPIDRFRDALDPGRAQALERYALALGEEMRALDEATVQRLAAKTATPWNELDARAGLRLAGLKRDRDVALGEHLRALRELGAAAASEVEAELGKDGPALIEAYDSAADARGRADRCQEELRELEAQTTHLRDTAGGPQSLLLDRPEAAIHHAAHAELVRRERERARPGPTAETDKEPSSLNRKDIADMPSNSTDKQNELTPSFAAERLVVDTAAADARTLPPSAGAGEWRWIGESNLLSELGVTAGRQVDEVAYGRLAGGRHAETDEVVRKGNTVKRGSQHTKGLYHQQGSFQAPQASSAWREAGPEEREAIREALVAETKAGIALLTGTDRFVGAATVAEVGEGAEATVRVDWVALGADRGKGLENPSQRNRRGVLGNFGQEAGERLQGWLATRAEEVAVEVRAPRTEAAPAPVPRNPPLPEKPLRDSLTANLGVLGVEAASWIKAEAEKEAMRLEAHMLSEEELRENLPTDNPFANLPEAPGREELKDWWAGNGETTLRMVAIEGQLIDNARRGYAALAEGESGRREDPLADPMKKVRETRGEEFAKKVERHAAVLASHLGSMPEEERQARTAAVHEYLNHVHIEEAEFGAIAQRVALQHGRNLINEVETTQQREATPPAAEVAPAADLGAAIP